jgi:hypothetical protein
VHATEKLPGNETWKSHYKGSSYVQSPNLHAPKLFELLPSSTLLSVAQYTQHTIAVVHKGEELQGITKLLKHPCQAPGRRTHHTVALLLVGA